MKQCLCSLWKILRSSLQIYRNTFQRYAHLTFVMDTVVHHNWSFSKTTNCYPSIENGSIFKLLRRHKYYILPWLCENVVLFSTLMHQNFEKVTHFSQKILFIKLVWRYIWGVSFLIIQTYTYTQFYNNIGCEILCQNLSYILTTSLILDISHWNPWIVSGRNHIVFFSNYPPFLYAFENTTE